MATAGRRRAGHFWAGLKSRRGRIFEVLRKMVSAVAIAAVFMLAGCGGSGDHEAGHAPAPSIPAPQPIGKTVRYTADGSTATVEKYEPKGFDSKHPKNAAVRVKFCVAKSEKGSAEPGNYGWVMRGKDGTLSQEAESPTPGKPGKLLKQADIPLGTCESGWVVIAVKGPTPKFVQIDTAAGLVRWKLPAQSS